MNDDAPALGDLGHAVPHAADVPSRPAAVLVPIVLRAEPSVLLTLRADHLSSHAGQVAFPGGRIEPGGETPLEAALREAEEEIGLARAHVTPIGVLPAFVTITGYQIRPVVGFVRLGFSLQADANEVADIFEVPFLHLMNRAHHERHSTVFQGVMRDYFVIAGGPHRIWGVTAGIIVNLCDQLYGRGDAT